MPDPFEHKWAILIGPTDYQYVNKLKYCTDDIVDIGNALRKTLEFPDKNILQFGTNLKLKPERATIYHQVGGLLKSGQIKENDLLLFYFSGHGIKEEKDYLLPVDASPNDLKNTGIEVENLVEQLTGTRCKNVVMFIDACREAISGQRGVTAIGEDSKVVAERKGVITFFSCDPRDMSYEIDELKHGSFTHCLLRAINSGKYVTADEIYKFLLQEVPLTNQQYKKPPQRPYAIMMPEEKKDLRLLYSAVQIVKSALRVDALLNLLGDIYTEGLGGDKTKGLVGDKYLEAAIEFLDTAKDRVLAGDDVRKMDLIERLCQRRLKPRAFEVAWDAIERRRGLGDGQINIVPQNL